MTPPDARRFAALARSHPQARRQELAPRPLAEPDPSRLPPDHPRREEVLRAHAAALAAGEDTYADPGTGLVVLTAGYLADRGRCCGSGCRHCPYVDTRRAPRSAC